jgi:hypothetical protein
MRRIGFITWLIASNVIAENIIFPTESVLINGTQIQQRSAMDPLSASGVDRRFMRIKVVRVP